MNEYQLQISMAIAAVDGLRELVLKQQARLDILDAKVQALERLPRPAVPAFTREPRERTAYDRCGPVRNDPRSND